MNLESSELDLIALALAQLSLSRPGWHPACLSPLARKLERGLLYEQFRTFGPDQPPEAAPVPPDKITTLEQLYQAALEKRAVCVARWGGARIPAAFMVSMQGAVLASLLRYGIHLYPKPKTKTADEKTPRHPRAPRRRKAEPTADITRAVRSASPWDQKALRAAAAYPRRNAPRAGGSTGVPAV